MLTYVCVNISIITLAFFCFSIIRYPLTINGNNKDMRETLFITISFLILLIIAGFRGDFTSDYKNYTELFHYFNNFRLMDIVKEDFYQEIGYVVLNKIIGIFSNNQVYLMLITSFIILMLIYKEIIRESSCIWLSILLFINVGAYYTSFNITRQIIASAIIFTGSKYLYDRNFIKYLWYIILASLFHKTSLIMILFYFVLNIRIDKKYLISILITTIVSLISINVIIKIIQIFFYSGYNYGMNGLNLTSVVIPLAILTFILGHINLVNNTAVKYNIWVNSALYYAFFSVLGLKVQMIQRLTEFFNPYVLLLIPSIITGIDDDYLKSIYIFAIVVMLVLYNYVTLSGTGYEPYYFIWNSINF